MTLPRYLLPLVLAASLAAPQLQAAPVDEDHLISRFGVGPVKIGMSMADALKALTQKGYSLKPNNNFMVDMTAIEVLKGDQFQFALLWPAGVAQDYVGAIWTNNSNYRTAEGIGPGAKVAAAAKAYGQPSLSYSTYNEGREYCYFNNWRDGGAVSFRVETPDGGHAGQYPQPEQEYNETGKFKPNATVQAVEVYSEEGGC